MVKKIVKIPILILLFPVVLIIRAIKPIIHIRIGQLRSDRIGHLAANMDRNLCIRLHNKDNSKGIYLYYIYGYIANNYLCKMWSRSVNLVTGNLRYLLHMLDVINKFFYGWRPHVIDELDSAEDNFNLFLKCPSQLSFTLNEQKKGNKYLEHKGIQELDPYICFCARDQAYLKNKHANRDFSYHNYRNASISTHVEAVSRFLDKSNLPKAFRMGSVVSESLDLSDDRIVDYSCNGDRTDFLDLFLSAKCKLFLNSGSGIDALPKIFRTPQVGANITPLNYIGPNAVVFIPKKYWLVKEKRFLTFKEIIQSDIGYYLKSNEYINSGIELIENTADDIYYALVEANDRLNGVWEPDEQDIYMQKKFQDLFLPHPKLPNIRSPISAKFLRENSKLL